MLDPMAGARDTADSATAEVGEALMRGRRASGGGADRPAVGPTTVLALQRSAGNGAINALLAGRLRLPSRQGAREMDAALRELRRDEPAVGTVETGLKAAQAVGIPVDLEGVRPPPSALATTRTGFGPGAVPAKKPVPPPKPTPAVSPLGRAAAKTASPPRAGPAAPAKVAATGPAAAAPAPLSADALLQPPVPPAHLQPDDDPAFTQVTGRVRSTAREKRAHPPARAKAKEAQDAALPPAGDVGAQAKAAKADTMDAQRPGTFDKKAFIAAVKAAIEAKSPRTLKEAADYKASGKAKEVRGEVAGLVGQGKQGQAADLESATQAPPDQSKAVPKPVTPMGPEQQAPAAPIAAAGAVPKPAPADQLNLAAGKHEADQTLADGEVTESQLAESNEPEFTQALADKKAAAAHADTAPGEFREQEAQVLQQGRAEAAAETSAGVAGMQGAKGAALAKLVADKGKAKTKDEAKRAEVTTKVQGIFDTTEAAVRTILDGIDPKVEKEFAAGEGRARTLFENYVSAKMAAYKKDRYGGWLGPMRWLRDKIKGMPAKVNEFYEAGRELYLKEMDRVISRVADVVGGELTAAKARIATGRAEIAGYVKSLPKDLQKVGSEASKDIGERFAELESAVDAKQESVVDSLASKYVEARKGLDERIEELQAENRGLIDKAIGAIKAVINTIRELVAMLKNVLARVAGVVGQIIKSPVKFLGNLIAGVKGGILKFKDDFLGHLRRGLMSWLFGALAEGGVELPKSFDLKGIIGFLASIFGLTWANIRNRIVKQIGERAMAAVEKGVEIFTVLSGPDGVAGLWQMLLQKLGDVKEMIFEKVKDFVQDRIIVAGIQWLIGLLNPAAAFIKACKLIYDVVMFFVNNAGRIKKFVDTILDSVADIVRGNIGGVIGKINDVLGQMVPLIIGFLASVIGLGGIGAKVRELVQKLQKPVNQAVDFVVKTGLKLAGPIIRGLKGVGNTVKAKLLGGDDSPAGKKKRLSGGMAAALGAVRRFSGRGASAAVLKPVLGAVRMRYGLAELRPVEQGRVWAIYAKVNPEETKATEVPISDTVLKQSVEALHGRVHGILKECKRMAKGNGKEVACVVRMNALETTFGSHDSAYRRLASLSRDEQLAIRAAYTQIDAQGDALFSELKALDAANVPLRQKHDQTRSLKNDLAKQLKKAPPPAWKPFLADYETADKAYKKPVRGGERHGSGRRPGDLATLSTPGPGGWRRDADRPAHLTLEQVTARANAASAAAATVLADDQIPAARKTELKTKDADLTTAVRGLTAASEPSDLLPVSDAADRVASLAGGLTRKPPAPAELAGPGARRVGPQHDHQHLQERAAGRHRRRGHLGGGAGQGAPGRAAVQDPRGPLDEGS